ncbi:coproporphyrinogen dehydrogenase HemZ [Candidatus Allofournierella merdavium]|uniref:coproporphyrinogen dehydrogenase HemZ n=1 Tax=Candidatus Allofournierella merdavium TaxID=2838593 RepID=UPI00374E5F87
MNICVRGLSSVYEPENVARLFFANARLVRRLPRKEDGVLARAGRRLAAGVRLGGRCTVLYAPRPADEKQAELALAGLVYELLKKVTGVRPPWGMLTGVRPVRIIHDRRAAGLSEAEIRRLFVETYDCTEKKFRLAKSIADLQRPILAARKPRDYSLYIGIPFCPSRCSYCSFVSLSTQREGRLMEPYLEALCREIEAIRDRAEDCGLDLKTIYIGGGTPTSLSADGLRKLMGTVAECFDLSRLEEYTVEAGRPDCTDAEKLAVLKEYGASRISINPQTFSDAVLERIGRKHSAADILRCFEEARAAGHDNINMDLIAGLPGDTVDGFAKSLRTALSLSPENITVHTLTLKRASNLVIGHADSDYGDVAAMLEECGALADAGYQPYYLYRQKGTLQNLENTGWCKPGKEGYYNIYIMEEVHSILSAGAGGSTKLVQPGGAKIERIFNYKYPAEYISGFDTILQRKEGVSEFYARYLDPQTAG